jgi:glycosyltransferase involved in cell wall biosynthesis
MKLLFASNLFPDAADPVRGLDNACLLHQLRDHCEGVRAIAIRPTLGRRRDYRARAEDAALAPVFCPARYIPKVGSRWNHALMARQLGRALARVREEFSFDLVLGAWLYPDGCALARLAPRLGFRYWLICQGSDAHGYLGMPVRRRLIVAAAAGSCGVITRSADLARRLAAAGVDERLLHPVYNGVDTALFRPAVDPGPLRRALGLEHRVDYLLFVGNLLPVKNPLLLLDAWRLARAMLPHRDLRLIMIGAGPLDGAIRAKAAAMGLTGALELPGRLPPTVVADHLRVASCLVLASHNEGVPNVILEAFASGVPVVATDVGGVAEVLDAPFLGRRVPPGNAAALAAALAEIVANPPPPAPIAARGAQFSWPAAARRYAALLAT